MTEVKIRLEKLWGKRVKERRDLLGLSQRDLAGLVVPPTTQATIYKIENGKITPRDHLKQQIAAALRTTTSDLFPWADQVDGA